MPGALESGVIANDCDTERGNERARGTPACCLGDLRVAPMACAQVVFAAGDCRYEVVKGDTLMRIAQQLAQTSK